MKKYLFLIIFASSVLSDESPDAADIRDFAITMQQAYQPEDVASREDAKYDLYIQKSDFSNAELGYHPCNFKTNGSLGHHQDEKPVDISPENRDKLKAYLMSKACYYGGRVINIKQKGQNQEMDFDSAASAFLDTYAGSSPLCITGKLKHLCLGSGSYHSGIFIGEWENGMPNGQGVALITSNFPGFEGGYNNREGLFKGVFKNGYPHGSGYYTDGKKTYDGGWHSGEMHGDIGWIYPPSVVYGFRYDFDYESGLLKIIHITEGSPAEQAGMKVGDTILAYQLGENSQIKEIQSIPMDIFSDEINRSKQILLHINSLGNIFNIQKSEIYTYYASYSDCVNNTNKAHGCKEKAKLNNRYTGNVGYGAHNGAYAKGSFKMGTRHSYDQWDRHTVYYNDGTNGSLGFFCDGGATPWIGGDYNTTSGTSENAISHEGSSNVWMQPNFYISPCIANNAAMVYPELILENEKLLEKSWSEIKQNNIQMRKIDFTYLLKEAIEQKDSLALWDERKFNLKSLGVGWSEDKIHALCQYSSTIMNNSCRSLRPSDSSLDKIRSKIAMNPMTKANKTKNQQQLAHAKFNYAFLKKTCKGLSGYQCASTGHSLLIHKQYWRCKYFGYPDITCLQKIDGDKKYNEIFNYIKDNPEEFINIDFSEWLLGKELEF